MDELMISGRRYISSLRAAKENGYHSDYIGQLIRGDKVKGQKVGRAWYVDEDSLTTYLGKNGPTPTKPPSQPLLEKSSDLTSSAKPVAQKSAPESPSESPRVSSLVNDLPVNKARPDFPHEIPTPITTGQKVAEDPDEHRIQIAKVADAPEPTIRISIAKEEKKKGGLTYISDDEPLLPEIRKGQSLSRKAVLVEPEEVPAPMAIEKKERVRNTIFLQGLTLAGVGVLVLILITALSTLFVTNLSVGGTETAGVQFSVPH